MEDGKNLFGFTYIGNTAYAHILAAKAPLRESQEPSLLEGEMKVNGESFVVTNDEHMPFWEVILAVSAEAGYPVTRIWRVPRWLYYGFAVVMEWVVWGWSLGEKESLINRRMVKYLTMTGTFDISKAKQRVGYEPQVSMHEGIKRVISWFLENERSKKEA